MNSLKEYSRLRQKLLTEKQHQISDQSIIKYIQVSPTIRIDERFFELTFDFVLTLIFISYVLCLAVIVSELTNCIIQLIRRLYNGQW